MGSELISKPYKNSDYIRSLVQSQLLMELNLSEFIDSNQLIKISKRYTVKGHSKTLEKMKIENYLSQA